MKSGGTGTWLTMTETAALLGVHYNTVLRYADNGKLPFWRTPGGHRRFRREDVLALLATSDSEAS